MTVRSFFASHLVPLPQARPNITNGDHPVDVKVTASDFLGYFKRVLEAGRLTTRDRAVEIVMLQSGMDAGTLTEVFNYIGFPQLATHFGSEDPSNWNVELRPVRVDLIRPKSGYRYYTFLDIDSINVLRMWFWTRGRPKINPARPGVLPTSDPIFLVRGKPMDSTRVARTFNESGKRAGVNLTTGNLQGSMNRYPFHSHECRDTLITTAKRAGAEAARSSRVNSVE